VYHKQSRHDNLQDGLPLHGRVSGAGDSQFIRTMILLFAVCGPKYAWLRQHFKGYIVVCNGQILQLMISCCIAKKHHLYLHNQRQKKIIFEIENQR